MSERGCVVLFLDPVNDTLAGPFLYRSPTPLPSLVIEMQRIAREDVSGARHSPEPVFAHIGATAVGKMAVSKPELIESFSKFAGRAQTRS